MAGLTLEAGTTGEAEARSLKTYMEAVTLVDEDVKNQMVQTVKIITMGEFEDFSNNADELSVGSRQKE